MTLTTTPAAHETFALVSQLTQVRAHERAGRSVRDRVTAAALAGSFVAVALAGAWHSGGDVTGRGLAVLALLVAVYALASRTQFESVTGAAVPTQPVFVAMLFVGPVWLVPAAVLAGLLVGARREEAPGGVLSFVGVHALSGWHSVGPVVVLSLAGISQPRLEDWPVLLMALAAQFAVDAATAASRCWGLAVPLPSLWRPLAWTFGVDLTLAPIGLALVMAAGTTPAVAVLALAPVALVALLSHDRSTHLGHAVTLGEAYSQAEGEARLDPLTGLPNRRAWDEALEEAEQRVHGPHPPYVAVVVMADLDHLKVANDTLGHAVGDELIRRAGHVLAAAAGPSRLVARLGGDEFGILSLERAADADGAALLARLRSSVAASEHVSGVALSVSLGAASWPPAADLQEAVRLADDAAQADKAERRVGRDRRTTPNNGDRRS